MRVCVYVDLLCWVVVAAGFLDYLLLFLLSDAHSSIFLRIYSDLEGRSCTLAFLNSTDRNHVLLWYSTHRQKRA